MDTLTVAYEPDILSLGGLRKWKYRNLLSLTESLIGSWGARDIIISVNQQRMKDVSIRKDFMSRFGNSTISRQFHQIVRFIIRTETLLIMISVTLIVYHFLTMLKQNVLRTLRNNHNILSKSDHWLFSGINQRKDLSGINSMARNHGRAVPHIVWYVLSAVNPLNLGNQLLNIVLRIVRQNTERKQAIIKRIEFALSVENNLQLIQKAILVELAVRNVLSRSNFKIWLNSSIYNLGWNKGHGFYSHGLLFYDALSGAYEELNESSFAVWNSVLKKKIEAQKEAQNG